MQHAKTTDDLLLTMDPFERALMSRRRQRRQFLCECMVQFQQVWQEGLAALSRDVDHDMCRPVSPRQALKWQRRLPTSLSLPAQSGKQTAARCRLFHDNLVSDGLQDEAP